MIVVGKTNPHGLTCSELHQSIYLLTCAEWRRTFNLFSQ